LPDADCAQSCLLYLVRLYRVLYDTVNLVTQHGAVPPFSLAAKRKTVEPNMEIIPAVDIRAGRCVRLYQGDYSQETVFDEDPVTAALTWCSRGAQWLHIVDLDGAAAGEPKNVAVVEEIIKQTGLFVELGGGIRQEEVAEKLLRQGISRIILGTAAIENRKVVKKLCRQFDDAIAVSLDARDGKMATHGWQKSTVVEVLQLSREMADAGVRRFIYTDIRKDGTLTEPNFDMIERLLAEANVPVIVAGGISRLEHLRRLKELGLEGAIIGKALYTGDIDLGEAIINFGT
jgi:phosphoribosylformimino-5-aminoimidazole carboxamide ribotide isomerase